MDDKDVMAAFSNPAAVSNTSIRSSLSSQPLRCPSKVVALKTFKHQFHEACIKQALQSSSKCPTCRVPLGEPRGMCPTGSMVIYHQGHSSCAGYSCGSIVIK